MRHTLEYKTQARGRQLYFFPSRSKSVSVWRPAVNTMHVRASAARERKTARLDWWTAQANQGERERGASSRVAEPVRPLATGKQSYMATSHDNGNNNNNNTSRSRSSNSNSSSTQAQPASSGNSNFSSASPSESRQHWCQRMQRGKRLTRTQRKKTFCLSGADLAATTSSNKTTKRTKRSRPQYHRIEWRRFKWQLQRAHYWRRRQQQ